ncbi:450ffccc-04a6-46dc-8df4-33f581831e86 [Sclerotinia trifoliorum]|uniref:450ffccc-04a6-46dc-8df4-33f581831e86 n=1 Tax=Sclerotinia trifoliorum TaxID=28548 RepID=A0A8H2VV39_9HELO|nr:450ffccc-04a6-46dc-8df4-33f581831e86 [Sclerotinia trifoliorum]
MYPSSHYEAYMTPRDDMDTHRRKKYKLSFYDVFPDSGPGAVLLCAINLGRSQLITPQSVRCLRYTRTFQYAID